ncbi:MAG: hypothetical protein MZV64_28395 [Ignavibacteriales bacterium]|nr:hypothetical protein [Ignavibacteriales bacterium]
MAAGRRDPRIAEAAEAQPAHERAEQDGQGDRRRADHQLEQLEPDHLVDQRGAAAADEQQQEHGKEAARVHGRALSARGRPRRKEWPSVYGLAGRAASAS